MILSFRAVDQNHATLISVDRLSLHKNSSANRLDDSYSAQASSHAFDHQVTSTGFKPVTLRAEI